MEEKIYKIKIDVNEYNYFIIKNLNDFMELFNPSSNYNINNSEKNIKIICAILIDLFEKNTRYNLCLEYLKNKITEQYNNEKGLNRDLGFKINDELNKIAIEEYKLENIKIDLFCGKQKDIVDGLDKIAKKRKQLNIIRINNEFNSMELEDFNESIVDFNNNIEETKNNKSCFLI